MIFNLIKTAKQLFIDRSKTGVAADNVEDAITVLNSNLEFHVGDTFTYSKSLFGTSISAAAGGSFGFIVYLPKSIGSDVTSVSVRDDISWIRAEGKMMTLSNAHATVATFGQNMVEVKIACDNISALAFHTGVLRAPVTFTFE